MNRTEAQIRDAARDGAALLDANLPGWADRIEVTALDLTDCYTCVLGQLYAVVGPNSGYEAGVEALSGFTDPPWGSILSDSSKFAYEYGFLGVDGREYDLLNDEWRRLIAERAS